jgi:hypothetical protein
MNRRYKCSGLRRPLKVFRKFDSMEKLWLAFIMLEKYKKKLEEEWVKL